MIEPNSSSSEPFVPGVACPRPGRSARRAGKILVARDNRSNQKTFVGILENEGHRVTVVTTTKQVVVALLRNTFDLILLDMEIPELTGGDAAEILREIEAAKGNHVPIVGMTSNSAEGERCLQAGMDEYIVKPVNVEQLRRVIALFLPPADAGPAFDRAAALAYMDGDETFFRRLARMFVENASSTVAEIRAAIEQQDAARLEYGAHKVKGAAYPFFAAAVIDAAQTLESIGKSGRLAAATAEFRRFEAQIGRLLGALSALDADGPRSVDLNMVSRLEEATPWTV